MTAAHTPGPWTVNPRDAIPMVGFDVKDGGELLPIVDVVSGKTKAVAKANARLIAAAPQLAEALRACINCFETDPIPLPFAHARALLAARAALTAAGVQS